MREKSLEQGGYKKTKVLKMNNKGEANMLLIVGLVVVGLFLAYQGGYLNNFLGGLDSGSGSGVEPTDVTTKQCPTTGISTYTINVQDELASTATNVDAEYYLFNGQKLIKEGTTGSDGTVDVDVTCGKDYQLLLLNTTATAGSGAYSKILDLKARTAADTINAELVMFGNGLINAIQNPTDLSSNTTLVAGGTKPLNALFHDMRPSLFPLKS